MKKILLAGALAIAAVFSSSAENYSTISLSYDYLGLSASQKGMMSDLGYAEKDKSGALNGLGLQYNYGIGIGNLPMNVELGAKFSVGFLGKSYHEDEVNFKFNTQMMRLSIPISYIYHFHLKNNISIAPYVGLDFRLNLLADTKVVGQVEYYDPDTETYDIEEEDYKYSWFDKDEMGLNPAKRFQMGWHLGVRFEFNKVLLGIEGGTDFLPFWNYTYMANKTKKEHINTSNLAISIGYKF